MTELRNGKEYYLGQGWAVDKKIPVTAAPLNQIVMHVATSADDPGRFEADFSQAAPDVRITPRGGRLPKPSTDWIEFVILTKPGPRGDGAIELFANGVWIASAAGRIGHESHELGRTQYFKFGPYRESGRSDRWSVRYADFARGPRCEDVAGPEIRRQWAARSDRTAQAAV